MNLRELSEKLGLSQTTVSRALNGFPEVSERTRKRVLEAAERYNYRPNTRAQSLATGRARAIGHVITLDTSHEMMNPIFGDFIAGAGSVYAGAGYEMILSVVRAEEELDAYQDMASRRSVDGIIVHGPRVGDPRPELLDRIRLPFVVHGRVPGYDGPYSWLDINNRRAFRRGTEFLIELGHRRIALLNGLENLDFALRRRAGYESALDAAGIPVDTGLLGSGEMTETHGYLGLRRMLDRPDPPTAVLCASMLQAIGARRALDDAGLRMGRDVSIVIHDDMLSYLRNGDALPLFTALRSSVRKAGERCAEILLEKIATGDQTPTRELWESELMLGRSTARAPHLLDTER